MRNVLPRIIADTLLVFSILFLPWWAAALFALSCMFVFDTYFEAIAAGFVVDALYSSETRRFFGAEFVSTLAMSTLFFVALYVKSTLRYYR
jgi:hypothetical protein